MNGIDWEMSELITERIELIGFGKNDENGEEIYVKVAESDLTKQYDSVYYKTTNFNDLQPVQLPECDHISYQNGIYQCSLFQIIDTTYPYNLLPKTDSRLSVSDDGVNWKTAVFSYNNSFAQQPLFYRHGKVYAQNGSNLFECDDFQTWKPTGPKQSGGQTYAAFPVGNKIYMFYSEYAKVDDNPERFQETQYVKFTEDSVNWYDSSVSFQTPKNILISRFMSGFTDCGSFILGRNKNNNDLQTIMFMSQDETYQFIILPRYQGDLGKYDTSPEQVIACNNGYLQQFNGVSLISGRDCMGAPIKDAYIFSDDIEAIKEFNDPYNVIIYTDDGYIKYFVGYKWVGRYDMNFQLVENMDIDYKISDLTYYNGVYYMSSNVENNKPPQCFRSNDMMNWEIFDGEIPNSKGQYVNLAGELTGSKKIVGDRYIEVNYEEKGLANYKIIGDDIIVTKSEKADKIYFSHDGVYFLSCQKPFSVTDDKFNYIFEDNEDVVIKMGLYQYRVSKSQLYEELNKLKNSPPPYIMVKNKLLGFSTLPVTEEDRTLVPMRFLFENLDAEVMWDETTQTATAVKGDTSISFCIDNHQATVNGEVKEMDVPARLVNDKTMVPLRFLSEGLGYTVNWNEETRVAEVIE